MGSTVSSDGRCEEVRRRIQAGWTSWKKVSGVLCDRKLSAMVKGKMYKSVVRPAMLYGMETVAVTERQVEKKEVAELKMVRWALGVTRKDKIRNEYVRGTAKIAKLGDKLRNARLRWYGHVKRREEGYVGKTMMKMACQAEGKEEGQGEGGWIRKEKPCKGLELRKKTKSTGRSGKYFRAVATPNREKPKEEEEEDL